MMLPLLVVIEVISYLTRPLSPFGAAVRQHDGRPHHAEGVRRLCRGARLSRRLGLALAFMVAFTGLEILVAFLQAYVFAILTCIYLNDALHMHH